MPSARDPAVRDHPRYREFVRRGRLAGLGIVAIVIAVAVASVMLVTGV
jgi:hypothetical protein